MEKEFPGWNELYDVVDEQDRVVGQATRKAVHHDPKLTHRAVHVLVVRTNGNLLLQKRVAGKDIDPGKWDTSVGGHVDAGEDYLTAARREAREELGLIDPDLQFLYDFRYESPRETEQIRSYFIVLDGPVTPDDYEIETIRDWTPAEIDAAVGTGALTHNFEQEWRRFCAWRKSHR